MNSVKPAKLLLGFVAVLLLVQPVLADDPQAAARDLGNLVKSQVGDAQSMRTNLGAPLTSSDSPLSTFDGSVAFNGQITAPSSQAFLQMLIQPSGSGDLQLLQVSQDLDFDGISDSFYTFPEAVSGVCANGVISCDPGTWSDCTPYTWQAGPAGRVSLKNALLTDLGGCYCINNSCGSTLVWDNLGLILQQLGGGAVSAVQAQRPQFMVTEVKVEGPTITFYGQDPSQGVKDPGPVTQTKYYENPSLITGDTEALLLNQTSDQASPYSTVQSLLTTRGGQGSMISCEMKHVVSVNIEEAPCSQYSLMGSATMAGKPSTFRTIDGNRIQFGWGWDTTWSAPITVSGPGISLASTPGLPKIISTNSGWSYDQSGGSGKKTSLEVQGNVFSFYTVSKSCYSAGDGGSGYDCTETVRLESQISFNGVTIKAYDHDNNPATSLDVHSFWRWYWNKVEAVGDALLLHRSDGRYLGKIVFEFPPPECPFFDGSACMGSPSVCSRFDVLETLDDQCTTLVSDPKCTLNQETVDEVVTYQNFQPTGLSPLPSCRDYPTPTTVVTRCYDWWEKKRHYFCNAEESFDVSEGLERFQTVKETTQAAGGTLTFTDYRKTSTGEWTTEQQSVDFTPGKQPPGCEMACKTRKTKESAQVGLSGHQGNIKTQTMTYEFFYRPCDEGGTCPTEAGEEILKNCQCINEFAEAASILAVMNEAGKDLICSDGVKK